MQLLLVLLCCVWGVSAMKTCCVKVNHLAKSDVDSIGVKISNDTTESEDHVHKDDSHRFLIDHFSMMTLEAEGRSVDLSYDEVFPLDDTEACTGIAAHTSPTSCSDGGCCKVSVSLYIIALDEDITIVMKARVNKKNEEGNNEFWMCDKEILLPAPTEEEAEEEMATEEDMTTEGEDILVQGWGGLATTPAPADICGISEVQGSGGVIVSPGYPDGYSNRIECHIVIRAETNQHRVKLTFIDLDTCGEGCNNDYISISNGDLEKSTWIGKYCGTHLPDPIISTCGAMYLRFHSDSISGSERGFKIQWESIVPPTTTEFP